MARRGEGEYLSWVFDRGATKPGGFLLENLPPSPFGLWRDKPGGGSFACGPRWLGRHSPLWGYSSLASLPTAKIPRRSNPRNFQTGSQPPRFDLYKPPQINCPALPPHQSPWVATPRWGGAELSGSEMVYLSHWMFAISPLPNPLPALRWRGEGTRGVGLFHAFEKREQL